MTQRRILNKYSRLETRSSCPCAGHEDMQMGMWNCIACIHPSVVLQTLLGPGLTHKTPQFFLVFHSSPPPLVPKICDVSLRTTSSHLVLGFPTEFIASLFRNHGTRWRQLVNVTTQPLYPQAKYARNPLNSKVGGRKSRLGSRGGVFRIFRLNKFKAE